MPQHDQKTFRSRKAKLEGQAQPRQPRSTPRMFAIAVSVAVVAVGMVVPVTAASAAPATTASADVTAPPESVIASDDFSGTETGGWGTADVGGKWTVRGPSSRFSVADGQGRFSVPSSTTAYADLNGVSSTDTRVDAVFSVDKLVEPQYVAIEGRRVGTSSYLARVRLQADGGARLYLLQNGSSLLAPQLQVPINIVPGQKYALAVEVTGTNPTTVKAKLWPASETEPAWQREATSKTAGLQAPGAVSVFSWLSKTPQAPVMLSFDKITAADPGSVPPTPAPPVTPPVPPTTPPVPPTTPIPNPAPVPSTITAGSAKVGTTSYSYPSNAIFATAKGTKSGAGSKASPYGSAQHAIDKAPSGSTIVLRGGTYHESIRIPFKKTLTIQSFPKEAVWLDGSSVVTGWKKSGNAWAVSGWNYDFDSRVSFISNLDETRRFVDPAYPMAGFPDQVWINDVAQKQVGSAAEVKAGTFFVDKAGKRLVLGTDPSGKRVDASTLTKAIQIHGEQSTLRGFGVRRYANPTNLMGAVTAEVPGATLENLVITENATAGLWAWADGHKFVNITLSENGLMGGGANKANGLLVKDSLILHNNTERFKVEPASGGFKMSRSENVRFENNVFQDNTTTGLWFDISIYNSTTVGNVFRNNHDGMEIEISENGIIADNYFVDNRRSGLKVFNSGKVDVWNNTFSGNDRSIEFMQDERRQDKAELKSKIPWVTRNVSIKNNVISYGQNVCPILTQDLTQKWFGNDFGIQFDGNAYHRSSSSSPSRFVCWANGAAGSRSFKSLADFKTHTKGDASSSLNEGSGILTSDYQLKSGASKAKPVAAPGAVATAIGAGNPSKTIGAITAYAK